MGQTRRHSHTDEQVVLQVLRHAGQVVGGPGGHADPPAVADHYLAALRLRLRVTPVGEVNRVQSLPELEVALSHKSVSYRKTCLVTSR